MSVGSWFQAGTGSITQSASLVVLLISLLTFLPGCGQEEEDAAAEPASTQQAPPATLATEIADRKPPASAAADSGEQMAVAENDSTRSPAALPTAP